MHTYKRATAIHFATKHFVIVQDIQDVIQELVKLPDNEYFHITTNDNRDVYFTKDQIMYMEQGLLEDDTVFRDMEFIKLQKINY